jgi:hypothetical protein
MDDDEEVTEKLQSDLDDKEAKLGKNSISIHFVQCINTRKYLPKNDTERMAKKWVSPIYAFYHARPAVEDDKKGRVVHIFACANSGCIQKICHYLDTKDAMSTSNMRKHAKKCWGLEAIALADTARDRNEAREPIMKTIRKMGRLPDVFESMGKGKTTYSTLPLSWTEIR